MLIALKNRIEFHNKNAARNKYFELQYKAHNQYLAIDEIVILPIPGF